MQPMPWPCSPSGFPAIGSSPGSPAHRVLPLLAAMASVGFAASLVIARPVTLLVGFALLGAGLGSVVPMILHAAGAVDNVDTGKAVAAVAGCGWAGYVVGPVVIGEIASATTLHIALFLIPVLAGTVAVATGMAKALRRSERPADAAPSERAIYSCRLLDHCRDYRGATRTGRAKIAVPWPRTAGNVEERQGGGRVMNAIETDYLVIGAGAAGMSFTDALIDADQDSDVVMVDRRLAPGGHWNDSYPFVRLHQPAACYGVNSRALGNDELDERGLNTGLYQQADGVEICDYFRRVMDEHHVASGQVRFFPMSNYLGLETSYVAFVGALTGATTEVKVRRAVVDARYLEPTIPSRQTPSFTVDTDVRCVAVNELADVREPATGYTIIGGGKTGSDACTWLLESGVDPDNICWIRARDAWMWNCRPSPAARTCDRHYRRRVARR